MGDHQTERRQERDPEGTLKPERVQKQPAPAGGTYKSERVERGGHQREGQASPRGYEEPATAPERATDTPAT
jgi:hypothetical protein